MNVIEKLLQNRQICINWNVHRRFRCSRRNARHIRLVKIDVCLARLSPMRIRRFFPPFEPSTRPGTPWIYNWIEFPPFYWIKNSLLFMWMRNERSPICFRFYAFSSLLCFLKMWWFLSGLPVCLLSFILEFNERYVMMHKTRDTCADGPLLHEHKKWWRYSIEMEWKTRMKLENIVWKHECGGRCGRQTSNDVMRLQAWTVKMRLSNNIALNTKAEAHCGAMWQNKRDERNVATALVGSTAMRQVSHEQNGRFYFFFFLSFIPNTTHKYSELIRFGHPFRISYYLFSSHVRCTNETHTPRTTHYFVHAKTTRFLVLFRIQFYSKYYEPTK